jgi:hypothetical protein
MRMVVEAAGVIGPGLAGWSASCALLRGAQPYAAAALTLPNLDILPAVERRRTGQPVKLAMAAGLDALAGSRRAPHELATVFTSSGADGQVLHEICETLAGTDRQVSPTRFHNSVHNAAAGYWSLATRSHAPSTSLCAYDWSFAAGLLEAAAQVAVEHDAVLLVSFDLPYCEPIHSTRPIAGSLGAALLVAREPTPAALARVEIEITQRRAPTQIPDPALEKLRAGNPTGRALPLLATLARGEAAHVVLDYVAEQSLCVRVAPC